VPRTYEPCTGEYSTKGLRRLSPKLQFLTPLPFEAEGLRREAALRAGPRRRWRGKASFETTRLDLVGFTSWSSFARYPFFLI